MALHHKSLMQLFLDHAYEATQDPGPSLLTADHLKEDLKAVGIVSLQPRELSHLKAIINNQSLMGALSYDQLCKCLLNEDYAFEQKTILEEKLRERQKAKEAKAKEKRRELHRNHSGVLNLEAKISEEAQRRLSNHNHSGTKNDFEAVFLVESRLRQVLDSKRARLVDAFKEMDLTGTGRICKVDLGKGLARLGVPISRSDLDAFFKVLDFDKSGMVEYKEFSRLLQSANLRRQQEKLNRSRHSQPQIQIPTTSVDQDFLLKRANKHVCFQVSDRKFHLRVQDLSKYPESVLYRAVTGCADKAIFLDLNPDVFEYIVNRFVLNSEPLQDMKPGVNLHMVNVTCDVLGFPCTSAPAVTNACAAAETAQTPPDSADTCECSAEVGTRRKHSFKLPISKAITSKGVDIHVRKNERLLLDSAAGMGQLIMDIFIGEDDAKYHRGKEIVVYDSRAYFHHTNDLEPIKLHSVYPGNAHYRFRSVACKTLSASSTITANFIINTGFTCGACNAS